VSFSPRPLSPLASARRRVSRIDAPSAFGLVALAAAGLGIALLLTLAIAAPAGAVVTKVGSTNVGIEPRDTESLFSGPLLLDRLGNGFFYPGAETFANNSGNPVVHAANTYVIYWDPAVGTPPSSHYHGDWQKVVDQFMQDVGSGSNQLGDVFAVDTQYTDRTNLPAYNAFSFHGAYTDTHAYPASGCTDPEPLLENPYHQVKAIGCLTGTQVSEELSSFIAQHSLPKGMNTIYDILTPPGVTVCLDEGGPGGHCSDFESTEAERNSENYATESYENSFCSYHDNINPDAAPQGDANTILYGVIPWTAGGIADGQLNPEDQRWGTPCQDGGFNPASTPIEEWEGKKGASSSNDQEPNQPARCPSPDGFCDTGLADLIVGQIAIQQENIVTDPLLNAWQDENGFEVADECHNFFAPAEGNYAASVGSGAGTLSTQRFGEDRYFVQGTFNLAALKLNYPGVHCLMGARLEPAFTAPNAINAGELAGFDGMESDITMNANTTFTAGGTPQPNYATYTWNFGDGSTPVNGYAPGAPACETPWLSPCAASVFHSYQYGGTYTVTLTAKDVAGNSSSITHVVSVIGPPPPSPAGTAGAGAAGTGGPGAAGAGGPGTPQINPPVAAALVLTHSLKSAVHKGLLVSYSVDQQVAGHFEVLLSRTLAKRLGISGENATGLPAGAAPEVVIGRALLVTTKGGRSSVKIFFSHRTASRLARAGKVSLMLRLVVRNGASRTPTTVISAFTLSH
jgi:hypothetical protein